MDKCRRFLLAFVNCRYSEIRGHIKLKGRQIEMANNNQYSIDENAIRNFFDVLHQGADTSRQV